MNEILEKINFFKSIQIYLKDNYKIIIGLFLFVFFLFVSIQLYLFNESKKILNTSIHFNQIVSDKSNIEFNLSIDKLSNNKSFYGILATLENIKIKLNNDQLSSAYSDYLNLLNNKQLNNLYKSAIAIHGSYSFLNKIGNFDSKISSLTSDDIYNNIIYLATFIDDSIESFEGFRLEILFLLSIMNQNNINDKFLYQETNELYHKIQESDKISSSLKERVKKIHEFQKYK